MKPDAVYRYLCQKRCLACGETKPLDRFTMNQGRRHSRCKECRARQRRLERAGARWETVWSGEAADMPSADQLGGMVERIAAGRCYEIRVLVDGRDLDEEGTG